MGAQSSNYSSMESQVAVSDMVDEYSLFTTQRSSITMATSQASCEKSNLPTCLQNTATGGELCLNTRKVRYCFDFSDFHHARVPPLPFTVADSFSIARASNLGTGTTVEGLSQ